MDTVKVPVVGNVKGQYVWIVGALFVGVVGYAYISRARSPVVAVDPGGVTLPEGTPPTVVDSNIDVPPAEGSITTNAQWTQHAIEYLISVGVDAGFGAVTLGKYLSHRPLTPTEQDVVLSALAGVGPPPQGTFTVTSTGVPVPAPVPAPTTTRTLGPHVAPGKLNQHVTDRVFAARVSRSSAPNAVEQQTRYIRERYPAGKYPYFLGGHIYTFKS